jgi:MoxR-like ATPase
VTSRDVRALALDVLRHRLVLSYEAHADGLTPDDVLDRVLRAVDPNAGEPAPLLAEAQAPGTGDSRWSARPGQPLPERHNGAAAAAADAA